MGQCVGDSLGPGELIKVSLEAGITLDGSGTTEPRVDAVDNLPDAANTAVRHAFKTFNPM
jgi:hypothetical protein